jgi:uncharacterized protein
MPREHVATTAFYRRLIRTLSSFFECKPDEETVFTVRTGRDAAELTGELLGSANVETLLLDTGYPPPEEVLPGDELAELGNCRTEPMLRLEILMQRLLSEHGSLQDVKDALAARLDDVRAQGYVALKSIAAYRTGLAIREWTDEEAEASLREYRRDGSARLAHKPLLDTDLRLGNPLHLRAVLEEPGYRGMPVVLLHECYPYTREGGYLAAVYGNVYLDLSYGIPLLGYGEMFSFTHQALGVAPISKLLYSSDGIGVPEIHWMSAIDGRRVIGQALEELVAHAELTIPEAEAAGESMLHGNAIQLYRLERADYRSGGSSANS